MLEQIKSELENRIANPNSKREIYDFNTHPDKKWPMPIPWFYDGSHGTSPSNQTQVAQMSGFFSDADDKAMIEAGIKHWVDATCITFDQLPTASTTTDHAIMFTADPNDGY